MKRAIIELDEWDLRKVFNASGIWEGVEAGTHYEWVQHEGEPDERYNQAEGTKSYTSFIYELDDRGNLGPKVAFVHYYRRKDGSIPNHKGMPDPKWCKVGDDTYKLATKPKPKPKPVTPPS